ncbi:TetR family transcriptional regulator C-terminal domain-containing protein [Streptomyces sp. NPDC001500]
MLPERVHREAACPGGASWSSRRYGEPVRRVPLPFGERGLPAEGHGPAHGSREQSPPGPSRRTADHSEPLVGARRPAPVNARTGPHRPAARSRGVRPAAVPRFDETLDEHRAEARVWLAFVAQAAVNKALATTLTANYASLQEAFTRLIAEAGEGADRAARLDPQLEARTLLTLADGLTAHVLIGHLTPHEAHDVLHTHLARLWEQPVTHIPSPDSPLP